MWKKLEKRGKYLVAGLDKDEKISIKKRKGRKKMKVGQFGEKMKKSLKKLLGEGILILIENVVGQRKR